MRILLNLNKEEKNRVEKPDLSVAMETASRVGKIQEQGIKLWD